MDGDKLLGEATADSGEAPTILPVADGQLGIGSVVKGKAKPGSVTTVGSPVPDTLEPA